MGALPQSASPPGSTSGTARAELTRTRRGLDVVEEIARLPLAVFPNALVRACLYDLFACDYVVWHWFDPPADRGFETTPSPTVAVTPALREAYESGSMFRHHGLWRWYSISGRCTPMTLDGVPEAVYGLADRRRTAALFRPLGLERQLAIPLSEDPRRRLMVLVRGGVDFGPAEVRRACRLQRPLIALLAQSQLAQSPLARLDAVDPGTAVPELTGREFAVVRLSMNGGTSTSIARQLLISPRTVEKHLENAYRKLSVRDRLGAWRALREAGLAGDLTRPT